MTVSIISTASKRRARSSDRAPHRRPVEARGPDGVGPATLRAGLAARPNRGARDRPAPGRRPGGGPRRSRGPPPSGAGCVRGARGRRVIRRIVGSMLTVLVVGACTGGRRVPLNRRGRRRHLPRPPRWLRPCSTSAATPTASRSRMDRSGWPIRRRPSCRIDPQGRVGRGASSQREGLLLDRSVRRRPLDLGPHGRHRLARRSGDGSPDRPFRLGRFPTTVLDRGDAVVAVAGNGTVFRLARR